jgi:hypothetical protein
MKKVFANYDWDDNIMYMPTNIIYFAKDQKSAQFKEIPISTEMFAHTRLKVSKESCLVFYKINTEQQLQEVKTQENADIVLDVKDYEISDELGSFREFRDCEKNQWFINDLKKALANKAFGPSFQDFVDHCSNKDHAKYVTIITARGQSPKTIHEGLKYLKKLKIIKYLPKLENIFPVSYKGLNSKYIGTANNPSDSKKNVIFSILDKIEKKSKRCNKQYSFGFSDDDKKTFLVMEEALKTEIEKGRWKHLQLNLYFTGDKSKQRHILLEDSK